MRKEIRHCIQAEQICGVVTLPCCNWYGQQESLFGRGPDLVYDDFSVLSNHREVIRCCWLLLLFRAKAIIQLDRVLLHVDPRMGW